MGLLFFLGPKSGDGVRSDYAAARGFWAARAPRIVPGAGPRCCHAGRWLMPRPQRAAEAARWLSAPSPSYPSGAPPELKVPSPPTHYPLGPEWPASGASFTGPRPTPSAPPSEALAASRRPWRLWHCWGGVSALAALFAEAPARTRIGTLLPPNSRLSPSDYGRAMLRERLRLSSHSPRLVAMSVRGLTPMAQSRIAIAGYGRRWPCRFALRPCTSRDIS